MPRYSLTRKNKENILAPYFAAEEKAASEAGAKANKKSALERGLLTAGDVVGNVATGLSKGIEGIWDLGAGVIGAVGGIFDEDFREDVKKHIAYDFTGRHIAAPLNQATEGSYLKDGGIVEGIAQGIGQMLPAVAVSLATAGIGTAAGAAAGTVAKAGQVASLATMGVSAAGSGTEEAYNDGADYYKGLGYGVASGAVEAATEKLGGVMLGSTSALSDTFIGKQLIKTGADKYVRSGVGKIAYNFASEGLEEVIADVASGVNKGVFNTRDEEGNVLQRVGNQDWGEIVKNLPKTFAVGGSVGALMDGIQTGVSNIKNHSKGGATYNAVIDEMNTIEDTLKANEAVKQSGRYLQEDVDEFETSANKRLIGSVEKLSVAAEKLTAEQRASLFSEAPVLSLYINNDGSVNTDIIALANEQVKSGKATNTTSRIYNLSDYSDTMKAAVDEYNKLHEVSDGTEIKLYEGSLTDEQRKNFTDIAKSVKSFAKKAGTNLDIAIIESNREDVNGFRSGNTVFITEKQLESGTWAESYAHEIGHFAQGSSTFSSMAKFLAEDRDTYEAARTAVTNASYGIRGEEIDAAFDKAMSGERLTERETRAYNELTAKMIGKVVGNKASIQRMARDDSTLAKKLLNRISDMIEALKSTNADKATLRRLRKAEILFEETLENMAKDRDAAIKKIDDTIAEYKAAKAEYKKLPEAAREAWLRERGYSKEDFDADVLEDEDLPLLSDEEREEYIKKFEREGDKDVNREKGGSPPENKYNIVNFDLDYNEGISQLASENFDHQKNTHLKVLEHTPQIYIDKAGASDREIIIAWDVAYLAMKKNGDISGDYHGLGAEVMMGLPSALKDPLYIIKQKNGRIAAVTEIVVKGKRAVFASIELETFKTTIQDGTTNSKHYNLILTITDAKPNYLQNTIFGGNIVYNKNNEDPAHFILRLKSLKKALPTYDLAESSKNSIHKIPEKINPSDKNSSKKVDFDLSTSEGNIHKRIAEWEKLKIYDKADAEKIINNILTSVMPLSEEEAVILDTASRKKAETMLWDKLNAAESELEMKQAAEKIADYIISRSVVKTLINDYSEFDNIQRAESTVYYLRGFLHNLNLERIKGEIRHKYDNDAKSVMLMWGSKKSGFSVDQIISEINGQVKGYGFPIDANINEADAFFAIHEAYTKASRDMKEYYEKYRDETLEESERDRLRKSISERIIETHKNVGRESTLAKATRRFKAELWRAERSVEYMKSYNKLYKSVDAFKGVVTGRSLNANTYKTDIFENSVENLKKIVRGGVVSVKQTRDAVAGLVQWYSSANPLVGDDFDADIYEKLSDVANKSFLNSSGERIEIKEILEPYLHRLNLSSIRDDIKSMYGEENRKVLAAWNLKKGYEPVELSEVIAVLEEHGVDIPHTELEGFIQINEMFRDATSPFTIDDLDNLSDIVRYFTNFVKKFNKIWVKRHYVDAFPYAKKYVELMQENSRVHLGAFTKIMTGRYAKTFMRPITMAKYADRYREGFYTDAVKSFREGAVRASDYEYEMMKPVAAFADKHPKYFEELGHRRIMYGERELPADIALSLYLTAKREQAQAGLAVSGFEYEDGKDTVRLPGYMPHKVPGGVQLGAERIQKKLYDEFSVEDKEFIEIVESVFNDECKKLKYETDMRTKGISNNVDGFYYPVKRAFVAKSIDSDFEDLMGRASNKSFNKDTVKGAKGVLCIMPLTEVLSRHVRGVSQYAALATVIRNFDTLYNLDIGGNANSPTSVASESVKSWKDGADYLKKLLTDVQGLGERGSAFLSIIRGSYAKYQLGANPKTWLTQLSSFFASTSELDYESIMKGFSVNSTDVDEYSTVAKLRKANNELILAQANTKKPGLLEKQSKFEKVSGKIGDILMTPIGKVDEFVISRLFGACQVQVEKNGDAKIGSERNKILAGKMLDQVIFNTQQNSFATERSAAMRSKNEIMTAVTMFSADGMNVLGQFVDALGELTALKARARAYGVNLDAEIKAAGKKVRRSLGAIVTSAMFMSAIALIFDALYHRIDEDESTEDIAIGVLGNFCGNMIGGLPVWRDAYSYFVDGYEVNNYLYSAYNDLLSGMKNSSDILFVDLPAGNVDIRKVNRTVREVIYSAGQLVGVPMRNVYNVFYSIFGFNKNVKYKIDDMFYAQSYNADLAKAIENGDEDAIANIAGLIMNESVGDVGDASVREELDRLIVAGRDVLPRTVGDTVTYNKTEYEMTNKQKKAFKEIYSEATDSVSKLIKLKLYGKASDEAKAKAVTFVYDAYYDLAREARAGAEEKSKDTLFLSAIDAHWLAVAVGIARTLESDKDRSGKVISGSLKKKVEELVESLGIPAAQKYMIMGYLGYTNKNGKAQVQAYINRLDLSKDEKSELLEYSGYKK